MSENQRSKLTKKNLLDLILDAPLDHKYVTITKFNELHASIEAVKGLSTKNSVEKTVLKKSNEEMKIDNANLNRLNNELQGKFDKAVDEVSNLRDQINEIEQYLRVNNVEIVGYPDFDSTTIDYEDMLLEVFNQLPGFQENPLTKADIDICHPLNTERKDQKNVGVCRFVSRKAKFAILEAKKSTRDFKYKDKNVYINEHLSRYNRSLFAAASEAKRTKNYKYLWVNNGQIFMRKEDRAPLVKIHKEDDIVKL